MILECLCLSLDNRYLLSLTLSVADTHLGPIAPKTPLTSDTDWSTKTIIKVLFNLNSVLCS